MEGQIKKCSLKNHQDKEANSFCTKCVKYMCKKCEVFHSDFFDSQHNPHIYDKKNFNIIEKDKKSNESIKEEDIKHIKEFINNIKEINNILKKELEKINEKKEEIKTKIQKNFTKLRDEINKIEDDLILKIDNEFENLELNEKIKKNEIIIKNIKSTLNNNSVQFMPLINELKNINIENENVNNAFNIKIPKEKDIDDIIKKIKNIYCGNKTIINSSIIKNDLEKQNLINDWIKEKMDKDLLKYEMIYKMSEHGSTAKVFHKYCDNKGPTLTIIKTKSNKIFGGFTRLDWKSLDENNCCIKDENRSTFIFSMNLMKKYEMMDNGRTAIYSNEKYGPTFGYKAICLSDNLTKGKINSSYTNFFEGNNLELIESHTNEENFNTSDIEVFKVI